MAPATQHRPAQKSGIEKQCCMIGCGYFVLSHVVFGYMGFQLSHAPISHVSSQLFQHANWANWCNADSGQQGLEAEEDLG
jgi:hypothetical protein